MRRRWGCVLLYRAAGVIAATAALGSAIAFPFPRVAEGPRAAEDPRVAEEGSPREPATAPLGIREARSETLARIGEISALIPSSLVEATEDATESRTPLPCPGRPRPGTGVWPGLRTVLLTGQVDDGPHGPVRWLVDDIAGSWSHGHGRAARTVTDEGWLYRVRLDDQDGAIYLVSTPRSAERGPSIRIAGYSACAVLPVSDPFERY